MYDRASGHDFLYTESGTTVSPETLSTPSFMCEATCRHGN